MNRSKPRSSVPGRPDRLHIREATHEELPRLAEVIRESFKEQGSLIPPSTAVTQTAEDLESRLAKEGGGAAVAIMGDDIVGCFFYKREPDHLYMERLAVLPESRGRGIGGALVDYAEKRAIALGLQRVEFGVRKKLKEQRRHYEILGYDFIREACRPDSTKPIYDMMAKDLPQENA